MLCASVVVRRPRRALRRREERIVGNRGPNAEGGREEELRSVFYECLSVNRGREQGKA